MSPLALTVWAPDAELVEIETAAGRVSMEQGEGGWWAATEVLPAGEDYRFAVDRGPARPDPRSRWQPAGVAGPSRVWDSASFVWHDGTWRGRDLSGAVVYELHVGTFSPDGTFDGVIERLDHLEQLGVTHIELMPIAEFPGRRGWGYDGVLLYAPHHAYGGPDGLDRLLDAAHERGLAVLLDVVYNHLGPEGNHLAEFGPYFSERHRTPWGAAVNLDGPGSPGVRGFFVDNARHWFVDHHLDGLRLDAVHALKDDTAFTFVEELAVEVERLAAHVGRRMVLVAEVETNDPYLSMPREAGGRGLDGQWSDDLHHAIHSALTGEQDGYYADFGRLADVATIYRQGFLMTGQVSRTTGARRGRPVPHQDGHRFVVCSQNHDQVGNRAFGERLAHLAGSDAAMIAAALVLCSPFVPMLFQGEEWAASSPFLFFAQFDDEGLAEAVRSGRREEFSAFSWSGDVPDPIAESSFEQSRLIWDELAAPPHALMLAWYHDLVAVRRAFPELTDGRLGQVDVEVDEDQGTLVVRRGRVRLAVATAPGRVAITVGPPDEPLTTLAASNSEIELAAGVLSFQGPGAAVLACDDHAP
jgi:maltooligosyltrehalose trehalohydrolase